MFSFKTKCPHCLKEHTLIDDTVIGQKISCPNPTCGGIFTVKVIKSSDDDQFSCSQASTTYAPKLNLGIAFKYCFQGPNWVSNFAVASLVYLSSFLIVPCPFFAWYMIAIYKNVLKSEKPLLPDWEFNKKNYILGLKFFLASAVLSAPLFVLSFVGSTSSLLYVVSWLLYVPLWLLMVALSPFLVGRFAETEEVEAIFDISGALSRVANNVENIVILIAGSFVSMLIGFSGIFGCVVGLIFTMTWSSLTVTFMGASVYKLAKRRAG